MPSKKREVKVKELYDGGTVASALTKEMRLKVNSLCAKLDREQAWIFRKALEQYLAGAPARVEAIEEEILDGGTVAVAISKRMRLNLNRLCAELGCLPAFVFRQSIDLYLNGAAV